MRRHDIPRFINHLQRSTYLLQARGRLRANAAMNRLGGPAQSEVLFHFPCIIDFGLGRENGFVRPRTNQPKQQDSPAIAAMVSNLVHDASSQIGWILLRPACADRITCQNDDAP
ncbi:MAG: hypothetical protein A2W31_13510 [Planctomycetes bacterium RBG_16_64_10]|nr:MAG: hypothetical protein A2W31_13510 [Planctomycetes bacterium RBG_16_64_10]